MAQNSNQKPVQAASKPVKPQKSKPVDLSKMAGDAAAKIKDCHGGCC